MRGEVSTDGDSKEDTTIPYFEEGEEFDFDSGDRATNAPQSNEGIES